MRNSLFVASATLIMLAACKSLPDIPSSIPLGVVTLGTGDAVTGVHTTSPAAYFVDAVNVSIPNSAKSLDTCAQIAFPGASVPAPLSQVDAGTPVIVATTTDTAQLTPQAADINGYVFYRLPTGDSITVVPGSTSRVTVPGSANGFHAFSVPFTNADSLHLQPINATADSTGDLTLNWNPQVGPHASVVVELEFSTSGGGSPNSQIFCQFTDNGSHAVEARLANIWRTGGAKHVHAYRFLTTPTNDGTDEMVIVSQYSTDSTIVLNP
jgi:hypothetical protein